MVLIFYIDKKLLLYICGCKFVWCYVSFNIYMGWERVQFLNKIYLEPI